MLKDEFEIIKTFKGGSLSSTHLINHPNYKKSILKVVSHEKNREYGFVRFCSQIKRHNQLQNLEPELFPKILQIGIDIKNKEAFCLYEFMEEYISLFDYLNNHKISEVDLHKSALNLINALKRLHSHSYNLPLLSGSIEFYIKEEMIRPLLRYEDYLNVNDKYFEDIKVESIAQTISRIYKELNSIQIDSQKSCITHGNSTLENILVNPKTLEISFIDVYDETYCDFAISDYSQIIQCSKYYYGIRMRYQNLKESEHNYNLMKPNNNFILFNNTIERNLIANLEEKKLLNLFSASQFIRLLPFRIENNDDLNANYFYSLASWILQKI